MPRAPAGGRHALATRLVFLGLGVAVGVKNREASVAPGPAAICREVRTVYQQAGDGKWHGDDADWRAVVQAVKRANTLGLAHIVQLAVSPRPRLRRTAAGVLACWLEGFAPKLTNHMQVGWPLTYTAHIPVPSPHPSLKQTLLLVVLKTFAGTSEEVPGMARQVLRAFVLSDPLWRDGGPHDPARSEATEEALSKLADGLCDGDTGSELALRAIFEQPKSASPDSEAYDNALQISRCEDAARNRDRYGTFLRRTIVERITDGRCVPAAEHDASDDFFALLRSIGTEATAANDMAVLDAAMRVVGP